ncbi:MAG: hypothetical protein LBV22_03450 [Mycoplasmataceae bacterium]|jgi:hypothetical protein|nr:hypothetical protein [Mycoplasmataceae bacterium]
MAYSSIIFEETIIKDIVNSSILKTPGVDKNKEIWIDIEHEKCLINIIYSPLAEIINVFDVSKRILNTVYDALIKILELHHNLLTINVKVIYNNNID